MKKYGNVLVEVCAGNLNDCMVAQLGGAHRIELNSGLHLGGLTPSLATLQLAKQKCDLPIMTMVRPRGAGFCYNAVEKELMFADAKLLLENGTDGIVFGFLNRDQTIDEESTQQMIALIHSYGKEAVFHRAIDCVVAIEESVETLIRLSCDRILTSGGFANVRLGQHQLARLQRLYGNQIEICIGSGVTKDNIVSLVKEAHITQCHASFKSWFSDQTTSTHKVSYRYHDGDCYDASDPIVLNEFMSVLQSENLL